MKKMKTGILGAALLTFMLSGCKKEPAGTHTETETDSPALCDSTVWGHLGEDTGMSAMQFVTDAGDTLEVYRTSPYTGKDGKLMGEIRNMTDRFALTLTEGNETMVTAVNVTQLSQAWHTPEGTMEIKSDGTVVSQSLPYNGWKLWNGHILFSSEVAQEYGKVTRVDTMDIVSLNDDSLLIRNHVNQVIRLGGNKLRIKD
ncbi:MAG: hypothetical protein IJ762_09610 [Bacteroidaceae bacterium]|nr:hypothetical protein [Bacteroidaceae bacterium]